MHFLTADKALTLFNTLEAMDLPHAHVREGCFARAHLMCREIEERGIPVSKAWLIEERAKFMRPILPGRTASAEEAPYFRYHVAPCLSVEDFDGVVQEMVFDPSFFDGPALLDEWAFVIDRDPPLAEVQKFGDPPDGYKGDYTIISNPQYTGKDTDAAAEALCARHMRDLGGQNVRSVYRSSLRAMQETDFLTSRFTMHVNPRIQVVEQPGFLRVRSSAQIAPSVFDDLDV